MSAITRLTVRAFRLTLASSLLLGMLSSAQAEDKMHPMTATPSQLKITDSAEHTTGVSQIRGENAKILYGDPSKASLYTVLLYIAPHKKILPLSHPDDGFATVISGRWYVGFGDKYDASKLKELGPGGIYTEPGSANHYGETRNEPAVIAITRYGPSGTNYVK